MVSRPAGLLAGLILLAVLISLPRPSVADRIDVIYPQRAHDGSVDAYPLAVLKLVLEKSGRPFDLRQERYVTTFPQSVQRLLDGRRVRVIWAPTNYLLETMFHPVRVPIYRGLPGYRLFLIQRDRQEMFRDVTSLEQLQPLLSAQGFEWPTREILETADLRVFAASYDTILRLVAWGRIDFFPRSLTDIFAERRRHAARYPELAVEKELLLRYRSVRYFFVNKADWQLAGALEAGFEAAYVDGSFLKLFREHPAMRDLLRQARLEERRVIHIDNPYLTRETAALPAHLLYDAN